MEDLARFETLFARKTGRSFLDRTLLEKALTHDSCGEAGRDFERMEFLGDSCLDLFIATHLVKDTGLSEGEMSELRAALTRKETLAEVLRSWGVEGHFRMGRSMDRSRLPDSIYADILESLIGALYLDQGYAAAEAMLESLFRRLLDEKIRSGADFSSDKNRLQELCMGRGEALPAYRQVGRSGPGHKPTFTVEVSLADGRVFRGIGSSRKAAELDAAAAAIEGIGN